MRHLLALAIITLCLSACVVPSSDRPFYSPPDVVSQSDFAGNRWRLEQILVDGVQHGFDLVAPVYFTFSPTGYVELEKHGSCGSLSVFYIDFPEDDFFKITPRMAVGADCALLASELAPQICADKLGASYELEACEDVLEGNAYAPGRNIVKMSTYELIGNHLILRGDGVEMWFILDNP